MEFTTPSQNRHNHELPRLSKSDLSDSRSGLVELMQQINYGQILDLVVRNGEPVLSPKPQVNIHIKLGGINGPRPEFAQTDFLIKSRVLELFQVFDQLRDCVLKVVEIQGGLPVRLIVNRMAA